MDWQKTKSADVGDVLQFTEPVFLGRYPDNRCIGERYIQARVTWVNGERKSIGLEILASSGLAPLPVGSTTHRLARNVFKRATYKRVQ
jgi:hypothetical protein